jgi:spermidine/putrescine-binding protein
MLRRKLFAIATLCVSAPLLFSCGRPDSGTQDNQAGEKRDVENVLNFYNWADYIAPDTIASFEKLTCGPQKLCHAQGSAREYS